VKGLPSQALLDRTRERFHDRCVACGPSGGSPARLRFRVLEDGGVEARFDGGSFYQGYRDLLHGGVITTLLDAAMTNCLFARGLGAMTAELQVRFVHPVAAGQGCTVRARCEKCVPPLFVIRAELFQGGQCHAWATGKFLDRTVAPGDGPGGAPG